MTPQATQAYDALKSYIEAHYPGMEVQTEGKTKHGLSTLRYRKSGKSFCAFYEKEEGFTLLIVLGAKERVRFEASLGDYSPAIVQQYLDADTFHDGKWIWFPVENDTHLEDFKKLLTIKRKPKQSIGG